jgi:CheY-like chemotaxis protein
MPDAVTSARALDDASSTARPPVLVVDDDAILRRMVVRMVQMVGHPVVEASDGHEALARLAETPDVCVVITDIVMPGMNGLTLLRRLREEHSEIGVILMSGYPQVSHLEETVLSPSVRFLPKPFTPEALADEIAAVRECSLDR